VELCPSYMTSLLFPKSPPLLLRISQTPGHRRYSSPCPRHFQAVSSSHLQNRTHTSMETNTLLAHENSYIATATITTWAARILICVSICGGVLRGRELVLECFAAKWRGHLGGQPVHLRTATRSERANGRRRRQLYARTQVVVKSFGYAPQPLVDFLVAEPAYCSHYQGLASCLPG
jgi:hypothetical protein